MTFSFASDKTWLSRKAAGGLIYLRAIDYRQASAEKRTTVLLSSLEMLSCEKEIKMRPLK